MAPAKPMRRNASDMSLDDTEYNGSKATARRPSGKGGGGAARTTKKPTAGAVRVPLAGGRNTGDNWASWQDKTRAQEADRVRQYQSTFVEDVTAARRAAVASLRRRETKRATSEEAYLQRVRDACGETLTETAAPAEAKDHPLYAAGREVLDLFQTLLARYEQTNEGLKSVSATGTSLADAHEDWAKDRAEARKLLQYGRVYGDSLVQAILVPGTADPGAALLGSADATRIGDNGTTANGVLNQTGRSALSLFPRSQATVASGETWGETAKTQMQALTGLVKTLHTGVGANPNKETFDWNWETKTASGGKSVSFAF